VAGRPAGITGVLGLMMGGLPDVPGRLWHRHENLVTFRNHDAVRFGGKRGSLPETPAGL